MQRDFQPRHGVWSRRGASISRGTRFSAPSHPPRAAFSSGAAQPTGICSTLEQAAPVWLRSRVWVCRCGRFLAPAELCRRWHDRLFCLGRCPQHRAGSCSGDAEPAPFLPAPIACALAEPEPSEILGDNSNSFLFTGSGVKLRVKFKSRGSVCQRQLQGELCPWIWDVL